MSITEFSFRLILIFIPGIISFVIVDNLTIHKDTKSYHWVIYSLLFGIFSYIIAEIVMAIIWIVFLEIASLAMHIKEGLPLVYMVDFESAYKAYPTYFIPDITDFNRPIQFSHIIVASLIALLMGIGVTRNINNRKIFKFYSDTLHISDKFLELDAWQNFLANYKDHEWIRVRDISNNRCYQGSLLSASDAADRDGIVLRFVDVYKDDTSEFLYSTEAICLPQKLENLIIELPEPSQLHKDDDGSNNTKEVNENAE